MAHHYSDKDPLYLLLINFSILCSIYYADDDDYRYKIEVCHNSEESIAVQQLRKKLKGTKNWLTIGTYDGAHVTGGSKYYFYSMLMMLPFKLKYNTLYIMLQMALAKPCVALKLSPARWVRN